MPATYTGATTATTAPSSPEVQQPIGSDAPNASSVATPLGQLADAIESERQHRLRREAVFALSDWSTLASGLAGTPLLTHTVKETNTGRWIFGGQRNGAGAANLARSAAGDTFSSISAAGTNPLVNADGDVSTIAYNPNLAMPVVGTTAGRIATSGDSGNTWTLRTAPAGTTSITFIRSYLGASGFVLGYNGGIANSTDGITWTNRLSLTGTVCNLMLRPGGGLWVAVIFSSADTTMRIYTSADAITWTQRLSFASGTLVNRNVLTYLNGRWVLYNSSSSAASYRSTDGITWTAFTPLAISPDAGLFEPFNLSSGVTHGGVCAVLTQNTRMLVTADGNIWTPVRTPPIAFGATYGNEGLAFDAYGHAVLVAATANVFQSRLALSP